MACSGFALDESDCPNATKAMEHFNAPSSRWAPLMISGNDNSTINTRASAFRVFKLAYWAKQAQLTSPTTIETPRYVANWKIAHKTTVLILQ